MKNGFDPTRVNLHFVDSLDMALDMKQWLGERRAYLGIDIETEGLNVGRDKVRLVQLGDRFTGWAMPYEDWGGIFKECLRAYDRRMVAHNALFELKFLGREDVWLPQHLTHDSMLMAHFHQPMMSAALKSTAGRRYGPMATAGEKVLDEAKKQQGWTWATVPVDFPPYWAYGALDAVLCSMLAEDLWPKIQDMRELYDIEMSAIYAYRDAEMTGLLTDQSYVAQQTARLLHEMDEAETTLKVAGVVPNYIKNVGSDTQVIACELI